MPSDIFLFPQSAGVGSFFRYLDRGPIELFFSDKPRSEDLIFKLKTLPKKIEKSTLSILKMVKYSEYSEFTSDLVPSPKCTFLRTKCEKTQI